MAERPGRRLCLEECIEARQQQRLAVAERRRPHAGLRGQLGDALAGCVSKRWAGRTQGAPGPGAPAEADV